ncbi:transglycosylase family protein [Nocardioidaceae bacterium]|nr:transglycosylase family protein [Nocardioidaceae bacterium]
MVHAPSRRRVPYARLVVNALLTLVLATLSALVALPAEAAPAKTWNRVASCESGGNWSINTGNGYYGGLQFWQPTWKDFGGLAYARKAHRATKAEQITVAERVLKVQGWKAWPACSLKLGLREPEPKKDGRKAGGTKKADVKKADGKKAEAKAKKARAKAEKATAQAKKAKAAAKKAAAKAKKAKAAAKKAKAQARKARAAAKKAKAKAQEARAEARKATATAKKAKGNKAKGKKGKKRR